MKLAKVSGMILATAMTLGVSSFAIAQDSGKQDIKNAGSETKEAVKDTGRGIGHGTKKVYHKTKRGVHKLHRKVDPDTPTATNPNPQ